jgi:hypothetical protein
MSELEKLASELQDMGYKNLTASSTQVSGVIDVSTDNLSKSVPEGEDTGPFATLDNPEKAIPQDIKDKANEYNRSAKVLGSGGGLHIAIV